MSELVGEQRASCWCLGPVLGAVEEHMAAERERSRIGRVGQCRSGCVVVDAHMAEISPEAEPKVGG
jgi:hypothetical protein